MGTMRSVPPPLTLSLTLSTAILKEESRDMFSYLLESSLLQFHVSIYSICWDTENRDNAQHPSYKLSPWGVLVISIGYTRPVHTEPNEDNLQAKDKSIT